MFKYKNFVASIDYDNESNMIHGEVINTLNFVGFQGSNIAELREAFENAVDDYLKFSNMKLGEEVNCLSGLITLQLPSELHKCIARRAIKENLTINQWIEKALRAGVSDNGN